MNKGTLTLTEDPMEAVKGVQFIHTDVWVSMGEPPEVWEKRIKLLKPYQVNADLMAASGNPRVRFMHCLPAFHNLETEVGRDIHEQFGLDAMEVTDEVFESRRAFSSNRRKTAFIPSRPCWWPHWAVSEIRYWLYFQPIRETGQISE